MTSLVSLFTVRHRNLRIAGLTVLAALFAFACHLRASENEPAQKDSGKKVILKVYQLPDARKTDAFSKADLQVIKAFNKKYPEIELRSFAGVEIEGMSMDSKPLMAIAGGVSPDVIYVNFRQSDSYINGHFLLPLDSYIDKLNKEDPELIKLRVPKPVWPVIERKGPEGNKAVWAMPYGILARVLVYRKDLMSKCGLDPSSPPKTWDELFAMCKTMTDPVAGTYGILLATGKQSAWDWVTYLWSAGGDVVVQGEDENWHAVFNSDAAVDAMVFYLKLCTTKWKDVRGRNQVGYAMREAGQEAARLWAEGKIGFRFSYMTEQDMGKGIDPNLYGMAPAPYSWNNMRAAEINATMMGIFSEAGETNNSGMDKKYRDPDMVKDAAWKYIWFYDSEEARKIRTKTMVDAGFGKLQNPVYLKRYGFEEYLRYIDPAVKEVYSEALQTGKPEPYGKKCQMVYTYLTKPLDTCISEAKEGEGDFGKLGASVEEARKSIKKILDTAVRDTNENMIGYLPEKDRIFRLRVALGVAIFIFFFFSAVVYKVWQIFTPKDNPGAQGWLITKYMYAYFLLIPGLGLILLWKYVPMFMGSVMAFQDYQIVGDSQWIGLGNFAEVLWDKEWWSALAKTLYYMALMLTVGFVPPIVLAILLQEVSHGKIIYRTIYYLPAVITGVIVVYLWKLMFSPNEYGPLNQLLMAIGLEKLEWLQDESLAMICCVIPQAWASLGPACLIYLAALKGIPDDSYEAADLDGASFVQKVRHIVIPSLKALIIIQFINAFIAASQQTDFILVMTFGGPNGATKVAGLMIFEKAYLFLKFGIATTMAWMLGVILLSFTVLQLRKLSNMEFKAAGGKA